MTSLPRVAQRVLPFAALFGLAIGPSVTSAQARARAYDGGRQVLDLDGTLVSTKSVEGGGTFADVVLESVAGGMQKKHIAGVKFDDFTIQVSPAMPKLLADWVTNAWNRNYTRKNGAVVETDFNDKELVRHNFKNAVIAETTIPTLDAGSRSPGFITITVAPEIVQEAKGTSAVRTAAPAPATKAFLVSNFSLDIGGLGGKISKIDSFTVKQKMNVATVGEEKMQQREAGTTVYPNLVVTMSETGDDKWVAWFQDFLIKGNNGEALEKSGKLTLLGPDMKTVLATITLYNVGIYGFEPVALESGTVRRMQAKLYVERMEISPAP